MTTTDLDILSIVARDAANGAHVVELADTYRVGRRVAYWRLQHLCGADLVEQHPTIVGRWVATSIGRYVAERWDGICGVLGAGPPDRA